MKIISHNKGYFIGYFIGNKVKNLVFVKGNHQKKVSADGICH